MDKGLAFVREQCSEPVATSDINIVTSITKYMQSLLYRMAHPPKSGDIPLKNLTTRQLTNIYRFNLGEEMSEEMQVLCYFWWMCSGVTGPVF